MFQQFTAAQSAASAAPAQPAFAQPAMQPAPQSAPAPAPTLAPAAPADDFDLGMLKPTIPQSDEPDFFFKEEKAPAEQSATLTVPFGSEEKPVAKDVRKTDSKAVSVAVRHDSSVATKKKKKSPLAVFIPPVIAMFIFLIVYQILDKLVW